jgi:hypothetical protein
VVGKVRLKLSPWVNHSWHVTLYLTARGLTTSPIPHGLQTFEIAFDFLDHELRITTSGGTTRSLKLEPQSVAEFYRRVMEALRELGLAVTIDTMPNELVDPTRFELDETHRSYDADAANRFWRVLEVPGPPGGCGALPSRRLADGRGRRTRGRGGAIEPPASALRAVLWL